MNKIYQKSFLGVKNAGFTLIELLVVVLIIGILSSIALPQYTKAVKKARGTEAMVAIKAIADAQSIYYLANGDYDDMYPNYKGDNLDIELPELKYFTIGTDDSRGCNHWIGSRCEMSLSSRDSATLIYQLNKGQLSERKCKGANCSSYFSCTVNEDGFCYLN